MELSLHHIIDHLYNIFLENDGSKNCAQLLEEEVNKMFGTKYLNDEHDCNVASMNSLNIYYDEIMPPIYDDYGDDMSAINNNDNHETCHHDFNFQSHDLFC